MRLRAALGLLGLAFAGCLDTSDGHTAPDLLGGPASAFESPDVPPLTLGSVKAGWVGYASLVRSVSEGRPLAPEDPLPRSEFAPGDDLLADLLGATLIDARDELKAAHEALERAGRPEKAERWMTEPPPWPPASVAKILGRESNAMPLVETLAAQLAPEADARAWLLRSWIAPTRPVDAALLDEIARAADGRLLREPRFRAWLRGEWTAWARQRYRRVARTAFAKPEGAVP